MTKFYTGIGSRQTPPEILRIMMSLATKLKSLGYVLRSGGADGADSAFERNAGSSSEIYRASDATDVAIDLASKFHPAWNRCSDYAKKLHGRNAFQVLGSDLKTPSAFVVCWTPDGCIDHSSRSIRTGGTGTAISIASANGIPVFNLCRRDHYERIVEFISNIGGAK